MSNINDQSLKWIDDLSRVIAQAEKTPDASHAELAETLNIRARSSVTYLLAIGACFDQTALEKVRQAASPQQTGTSKADPYIFSFRNAIALSRLKDMVSDPFGAVNAALDLILPQKLATGKITALVEWIKTGKPVAEFDPKKPVNHSPKVTGISSHSGTQQNPNEDLAFDDETNTAQPRHKTLRSKPQTLGQRIDALLGSLQGQRGGSKQAVGRVHKNKTKKTSKNSLKTFEKIVHWVFVKFFWHLFIKQFHKACKAVAHYMVPIKSFENSNRKRGSGSSSGPGPLIPTLLHWAVYCLCQLFFWWVVATYLASRFVPALKPWVDLPFRWLAHWLFVDLLGLVWPWAVSNVVLAIVLGVLLFLGLGAAFKAQPQRMWVITALFVALWIYGRGWNMNLEAINHQDTKGTKEDNDVVLKETPPTNPVSNKALGKPKHAPQLMASAQVWNPSDESKDYFEMELYPVPKDSVIKSHSFEPDTAMGSDMAYHLVMDLQSPDKYTVFYGRDKAAVKNIITGASQITLTMQIGLLSPLTGASTFNFYWADVKIFHVNLIETGLLKRYQCSLVLAESKKPLTIQCDSAVDMERLVSALEFYIKLSGHNAAPLTGLPYLNQGVRLDKDGEIATLWGNSPIDKAGLVLGDFIWSVGTKTDHQQSKTELETGLQNLKSGSNPFYYVTADGWKRALANKVADDPESFRPLRRKVSLTVP